MFRNKIGIIIMIFSLLICSCGTFVFPPLEISTTELGKDFVCVTFSRQPDRGSIETAFSFLEDNIEMKGVFSFKNEKVFYYLEKEISDGHEYILSISNVAEDVNGYSLQKDYVEKFIKKEDFESPEILSITPENEVKQEDTLEKITIKFSESIDCESFKEAFLLTPSTDYFLKWNEDNTIVDIQFNNAIIPNKDYVIKISTALKDLNNNFLKNDYKSVFHYQIDLVNPDFLLYSIYEDDESEMNMSSINSLFMDSELQIRFSKQIVGTSIASYLEVNPPLNFEVNFDSHTRDVVNLKFTEKPIWGEKYYIKISEGISDLSSRKTSESKLYEFIFDKEKNRPVTFLKGFIQNEKDSFEEISDSKRYGLITFDVSYFDTTIDDVKGELYLGFRISKEADSLDYISLLKNVSLSSTNNCISFLMKKMKILTQEEVLQSPIKDKKFTEEESEDWNIKIIKVDLAVENSNVNPFGLITLSLDSGVCDNLKNTMDNDVSITMNKA